ncbi:TolC family protein [Chitinophaga sp. 212800010-3]|uniref:TolC family protein n=1 Tax=unclassified Chitinophaga TaxID=2619133 RepID=UPI002DF707B5|nr:TolC family protein [Chitinophaga sp. 212800010-3]
MKKIFLIICLAATMNTRAQEKLSLQKAISTGLANRYDMQANKYNISISSNTLQKNRKAWIPDIRVDGSVRYNTQLQATFVPAGFGGLDKPKLLALGAKNATIFGVSLDQPVLQPSINTDISIARTQLELQRERNRADEINISVLIATAYYNVLLKKLQQEIALHNEWRFGKYYTLAEGRYKQGALIETDYLRAQLDLENAKLICMNTSQDYLLAMNELKYQMNLPDTTGITLTDTLRNNGQPIIADDSQYANRTEIKQLHLEETGNRLQLRKAFQYAIPVIALTANYSQQYLYNDFKYTQQEWWMPFSYAGVKISIPISGNIKNHHDIQQYQLKSKQLSARLLQQTADVKFEIQQTATALNNALRSMQTTQKNYELSEKIFRQQQAEFTLGSFSYDNLLETERSINNAEEQYIKSAYEYLMAQIRYRKAINGF